MKKRIDYNAKLFLEFINNNGETTSIERRFNSISKVKAQDMFHSYKSFINTSCSNNNINQLIFVISNMIFKENIPNVVNRFKYINSNPEYRLNRLGLHIEKNSCKDQTAGIYILVTEDSPRPITIINQDNIAKSAQININNNIGNFIGKKDNIISRRPGLFFHKSFIDTTYFFKTINNKYILPLSIVDEGILLALVKTHKNEFRLIKVTQDLLDSCEKIEYDNNHNYAHNVFEALKNPDEGFNKYYRFYIQYRTDNMFNKKQTRRVYINDTISYNICKEFIVTGFSLNHYDNRLYVNYKYTDNNNFGEFTISAKHLLTSISNNGFKFKLPYDNRVITDDTLLIYKVDETEHYFGNIDDYKEEKIKALNNYIEELDQDNIFNPQNYNIYKL